MSNKFRYFKSKIKISDREIRKYIHTTERQRKLAKREERKIASKIEDIEKRHLAFKYLSKIGKKHK